MSKPRKLGIKSTYIPNAKADMRHRKKVYQRDREKAGAFQDSRLKKQETPCATCVRWEECNGVDDDCPMRKERR